MEVAPALSRKYFYGVYLLTSKKPTCKYHTYVGFSVDPPRRLRQHNGELTMGAKRTLRKRPWESVLVVHGFPDEKAALRFEWAWQNGKASRHISSSPTIQGLAKTTVTRLPNMLKVVDCMLNTVPWNRLPLTIQWVNDRYATDFCHHVQAPAHMRILFGPIRWLKSTAASDDDLQHADIDYEYTCLVCLDDIDLNDPTIRWLGCGREKCRMRTHMGCLANWFLKDDPTHLLPVTGTCPLCREKLRWGDLIQKYGDAHRVETSKRKGRRKKAADETVETPPKRNHPTETDTDVRHASGAVIDIDATPHISGIFDELDLSSPKPLLQRLQTQRRKDGAKATQRRPRSAVDLFPTSRSDTSFANLYQSINTGIEADTNTRPSTHTCTRRDTTTTTSDTSNRNSINDVLSATVNPRSTTLVNARGSPNAHPKTETRRSASTSTSINTNTNTNTNSQSGVTVDVELLPEIDSRTSLGSRHRDSLTSVRSGSAVARAQRENVTIDTDHAPVPSHSPPFAFGTQRQMSHTPCDLTLTGAVRNIYDSGSPANEAERSPQALSPSTNTSGDRNRECSRYAGTDISGNRNREGSRYTGTGTAADKSREGNKSVDIRADSESPCARAHSTRIRLPMSVVGSAVRPCVSPGGHGAKRRLKHRDAHSEAPAHPRADKAVDSVGAAPSRKHRLVSNKKEPIVIDSSDSDTDVVRRPKSTASAGIRSVFAYVSNSPLSPTRSRRQLDGKKEVHLYNQKGDSHAPKYMYGPQSPRHGRLNTRTHPSSRTDARASSHAQMDVLTDPSQQAKSPAKTPRLRTYVALNVDAPVSQTRHSPVLIASRKLNTDEQDITNQQQNITNQQQNITNQQQNLNHETPSSSKSPGLNVSGGRNCRTTAAERGDQRGPTVVLEGQSSDSEDDSMYGKLSLRERLDIAGQS